MNSHCENVNQQSAEFAELFSMLAKKNEVEQATVLDNHPQLTKIISTPRQYRAILTILRGARNPAIFSFYLMDQLPDFLSNIQDLRDFSKRVSNASKENLLQMTLPAFATIALRAEKHVAAELIFNLNLFDDQTRYELFSKMCAQVQNSRQMRLIVELVKENHVTYRQLIISKLASSINYVSATLPELLNLLVMIPSEFQAGFLAACNKKYFADYEADRCTPIFELLTKEANNVLICKMGAEIENMITVNQVFDVLVHLDAEDRISFLKCLVDYKYVISVLDHVIRPLIPKHQLNDYDLVLADAKKIAEERKQQKQDFDAWSITNAKQLDPISAHGLQINPDGYQSLESQFQRDYAKRNSNAPVANSRFSQWNFWCTGRQNKIGLRENNDKFTSTLTRLLWGGCMGE